ncbi:hypothetical protein HZS61_006448 [Fusarium oxysporum f. sp. conglutinans]|uniref:Uncharacterized protein n=1 Tax=Fusarium oxysporum f. sp. conglutinans TaxID=100902 RepID=A0A8H6GAD8_FUSOX|nr:hypothetical protein HZS61_006448 [Fusarium oxysporum f. sp. conglutinans]KAG6988624.1 hypothetical protein FocnCong_v001810 [Fusarium oxysporum f. sp. conglutinans]
MVNFTPQKLDDDKNNDQFFSDARSGAVPIPIEGSRQMVYWRNCTVKVFNKGEEHLKPILWFKNRHDAQVYLERGLSILVEGDQIKEV